MATALVLGEDVHLGLVMRVRRDAAGLGADHSALDLFALRAAQQDADVVAGDALVEDLAEHLDAGHDGLDRLVAHADDLDLLADTDLAALDATGGDGAATGDGEHVLDRHEERLVDVALRLRQIRVEGVRELEDALAPRAVVFATAALERLQRRAPDDRQLVARELVLGQELTDLHLDELEQLGVVDEVDLVHVDDDVRYVDLVRQEHVLARLRHGAVVGAHDEDGGVHLRRTCDHVLDVVRVAGAVDMCIVALLGLVLDVRRGDGDAALALFRSLVDLVEGRVLRAPDAAVVKDKRHRSSEGGLAVVDVADGAHVHVRLAAVELLLGHVCCSFSGTRRLKSRENGAAPGRTEDAKYTPALPAEANVVSAPHATSVHQPRPHAPRTLATISSATWAGTSA